MEEGISAHWKAERIFERSLEERPADKQFVFYDGPPFATGLPHYGHLLQSTIKDAVPRYWTMQGYRVPRKWGWDCHGLPIENIIEKELKLGSKKDIEGYGIDKFNAACRTAIFAYEKEWGKYIDRLGRWVEFEDSYKTMDNNYIESVWWVFSELYKKDHIYKGLRVSLYCPRCATPISNFEVAMGNSYIDREDPAISIKFPVEGQDKTFFVAWTTTPWSVPGVTGLAVSDKLEYSYVRVRETNEVIICASSRVTEVFKDQPAESYEVINRVNGKEIVGMRVALPYDYLPVDKQAAGRVILGEHVTDEVGTGVVTTAPAYGEEDLIAGQAAGLPIVQTLDDEGLFVSACGILAGKKTSEANPLVIEDLQGRGLLWREEKITHSVAICWRCDTHLLYKAQPAWFVNVTKLKPAMLKTADKIHWHPEHFKEGRFGRGLHTAPDWNISRSRYWGSPLPVWECASCNERTVVGSVEELKKKAKPETWPAEFDAHRPFIDNIKLSCACGGEQLRIPEVFDCWFESGSMPVASVHYPFENKKWFEQHFPADFIGEAHDQTRGWFYTLHVLATGLFDKPAFKDVIVTGLILAEDGKKMSKKLKNYPDPWMVFTTYGVDALRYYLLSSPVVEADSLNFSERDLQSVVRGFLNLLWNVKTFYEMYAKDQRIEVTMPRSSHVLDRWLYSRFNQLLADVTKAMDGYELAVATRPLRAFVDDLSTWWLRRSRERFKSEHEYERLDALRTLKEILEEFSKVIAPFMPFIAERVYLDVGGQKSSVHLELWPKVQDRYINERLMLDMTWVRQMVSKGQEARTVSKLPVRQALAKATLFVRSAEDLTRLSHQADLLMLVRDELNVEQVVLAAAPAEATEDTVELDTVITPELRKKGLRREFVRQVMAYRKQLGLSPSDVVTFGYETKDPELAQLIQESAAELAKDVRASELVPTTGLSEPTAVRAEVGEGEVFLVRMNKS